MSLGKHLQVQQQAIEQLVQLLEQERLALAQAKVEGERLQELTASKQAALLKLEQLEAIRSGAQSKLGYGSGRHGAFKAADRLKPKTRRLCAGSMTPSSHKRADA